jgi:hypothetical protein
MREADPAGASPGAVAPKLPLWRTIRFAYATYFRHFGDVLRITWMWISLVALLMAAGDWMRWSSSVWFADQFKSGVVEPLDRYAYATILPVGLVALLLPFLIVDVAVASHRRLILRERPRVSGSNFASRAAWQYFALFVPLAVLTAVAPAVLGAVSDLDPEVFPSENDELMAFVSAFGVATGAVAVALRFSLVLPARAVGNSGLSLKQSWRLTRGNTWRLLWGMFACAIVPVIPLRLLLDWLDLPERKLSAETMITGEGLSEQVIGSALGTQLTLAVDTLTIPLCVGFLSLCYRHFIRRGTMTKQAQPG